MTRELARPALGTVERELYDLRAKISGLARGYVIFAVVAVVAFISLGVLVRDVHGTQESHYVSSQTERGLILQQNGEILQLLRGKQ